MTVRNRFMLLVLIAVVLMGGLMPVVAQEGSLTLTVLGTYSTGVFAEGAAEIVAYHAASSTLYVVNGDASTIDVLNIADPAAPTLSTQIDVTELGDQANSVAVFGDLVAVAIQAEATDGTGFVGFYTPAGEFISSVPVGVLPDMLTFTPDGTKVVTANEGEPDDEYLVDPEGSVSIIDISGGAAGLTEANVTTVTFTDFNADGARAAELPAEVRVYGPGATVAQDLEPEYVAITPDSLTAFVVLQEANAYAQIDLTSGTIVAIRSFGFKDHNVAGSGFDGGKDDGMINIANWPVFGMYQPDAVEIFTGPDGMVYLLTANEGDTRDYDGYSEEGEIGETPLDETAFPNAEELAAESAIGGLEIMTSIGDTDGDGDLDAMYLPGARSFSIWNPLTGELVWDSGDQFEQITAAAYPDDFNATNDENGAEDRSDNKGPEPEALAVGTIGDRSYAFVGLERIGGIMVYDITDPTAPVFVTYVNNRDFAGDPEAGTAGDLGPEGVIFIPATESPNGADLIVVANEVSGTTTIYQVAAN